jgi:guanylate kinase
MIYVITGPSGSGKTTLGNFFKELGFQELVSHTTREKRAGEVDGVSYHFVTREEFAGIEKIEESSYSGNLYGTSKAEVLEKLETGDVFAVTDVHGAKAFKRIFGNRVKVIYIYSNPRYLRKRMKERGDSSGSVRDRIHTLKVKKEYRNRLYADHIIVNNGSKRALYRSGQRIVRR